MNRELKATRKTKDTACKKIRRVTKYVVDGASWDLFLHGYRKIIEDALFEYESASTLRANSPGKEPVKNALDHNKKWISERTVWNLLHDLCHLYLWDQKDHPFLADAWRVVRHFDQSPVGQTDRFVFRLASDCLDHHNNSVWIWVSVISGDGLAELSQGWT
jgi:hypothetical protein